MALIYSRGAVRRGTIGALLMIAALSVVPGWARQGIATVPVFRTSSVPRAIPEFTAKGQENWLNSSPLTASALNGKVVLINFWTMNCTNCSRSFGWIKHLEELYGRLGFQVVGIHSPEFPSESDRAKLIDKVTEHALSYPIMLDNDLSYFRAVGNRAWPTFYVLDRKGEIRGVFSGETRIGDAQAGDAEHLIQTLIAQG